MWPTASAPWPARGGRSGGVPTKAATMLACPDQRLVRPAAARGEHAGNSGEDRAEDQRGGQDRRQPSLPTRPPALGRSLCWSYYWEPDFGGRDGEALIISDEGVEFRCNSHGRG